MKVKSKSITKTMQTSVEVTFRPIGVGVLVEGFRSDGAHWAKVIDTVDAVSIWRCLMGERTKAEVKTGSGPLYLVWEDAKNGESERWELCDGEALAFFNADQAIAAAWAIKKCIEDILVKPREASAKTERLREIALSSVWVLSCRRILTGDCAAEGLELIGGYEEVFSTREKAMDALREFMRPLVNDAHTESHWEDMGEDVDKELDHIIDHPNHSTMSGVSWTYEGSKQEFEVSLCERRVDEVHE